MNLSIKKNLALYFSFCLVALLLGAIFSDALINMTKFWEREEYSHGYLIPVISFWFIWSNKESVSEYIGEGNWTGLLIVIIGLVIGLMGEMASLYVLTQYAFLLILYGLCLSLVGWKGMRLLWFPLAYLFFMIALPRFLYNNLSAQLQLISSQLGVAVIRLLDISVFLQGNVIDLGVYKLQVVEACSGLRYLFPLASFGFLCGYLFRAKFWMRALVFISTLPITVIMNSIRIGAIGILVEYWGIKQADGFLHDFEGWIIFVGCLGVLFLEMWLLVRSFMPGQSFSDVFVVDGTIKGSGLNDISISQNHTIKAPEGYPTKHIFGLPKSYITTCLLLVFVTPFTMSIGERIDKQPDRIRFANFPLKIDQWKGVEVAMGQNYIDALKFDDYIIGNYSKEGGLSPINLYVAYYASQRKGASIHSPKTCMPGGGWQIGNFEQRKIGTQSTARGESLFVNRAIITKGESRQLVYYWFQQRGRIITNAYLLKWYLFWDALTQQRTDGALVRLVVNLPRGSNEAEADGRLTTFINVIFPKLESYIPS